jgi:hypothetical protein
METRRSLYLGRQPGECKRHYFKRLARTVAVYVKRWAGMVFPQLLGPRLIPDYSEIDRETVMKPLMSKAEVRMIEEHLRPEMRVLEWGAGGSTMHFSKLVKEYISIESDQNWANYIRVAAKVPVHFVPPSGTRPPDGPAFYGLNYRQTYLDYVTAPKRLNLGKFDAILIDGRARLFCALEALELLNPDGILVVHDFWPRPRYHLILQWCQVIAEIKTGQSLAILKPL